MVYTAQSQSLATLEMLVHLDASELLEKYVLLEVGFDKSLVSAVEIAELPRNWRRDPPPMRLQLIGDQWNARRVSAVLRVPSALSPGEYNFLLNPDHPDFARISIASPVPFRFDPRLKVR